MVRKQNQRLLFFVSVDQRLQDIENQNHIISGETVFWHKRGRLRGFHASVCGYRRRSVRFQQNLAGCLHERNVGEIDQQTFSVAEKRPVETRHTVRPANVHRVEKSP